jgi:outer membrane protein TolC
MAKGRFSMILLKRVIAGMLLAGIVSASLYAQDQMELTLDQSIEIACRYNRSLAVSRERVAEARAILGEARTGFFPMLSGSANYTKLDVAPFMPGKIFAEFSGAPPEAFPKRIPIGRDEIVNVGVRLQQPLFTGFSILNGYRMAKDGLKASRAEFQKDRNALIYQVHEAYWGLVKAYKFVEVAQEAVRQVEGHVNDLENMYEVGMITRNDLLKARVQLSNTRLMSIQAKNGVELAKRMFCNILGLDLGTRVLLTEELDFQPVSDFPLEKAADQARSLRPEMTMLQAGIGVGKRAVDMASAGYLPSLALVMDYGYNKPNREYDLEFYTTWTISLVASMNLFDWGATHYRREQARRRLGQLEESYENAIQGIRLEVTQSYLMLQEARDRIEVAQTNVQQAEENYKVTQDLFQQGMTTNTEFLDANTLLVQAKSNYITALADYKVARAKLQQAVGIIGEGE